MTYRGSFPPGQAYHGQPQPQPQPQPPVPDYSQYTNQGPQYINGGPQYTAQGPPQYGAGGPHFINGPYIQTNQAAHYHNQQQYVQNGAYTQPSPQQYYPPNPPQTAQPMQPMRPLQPMQPLQPSQPVQVTHQAQQHFQTYDGHYDRSPRPTTVQPPLQPAPLVEFVNPSFLQQRTPPAPTVRPPPPQAQPTSWAVPQPVAPSPVPRHSYPQSTSSKNSPRIGTPKTLAQIPRTKSVGSITKRRSSTHSVARSPSIGHASPPVDTLSLLICVAEDCFSKARQSVQEYGRALRPDTVKEYHKLIATGLGCLDVALQSNKVLPRLEARVRLRYASMLVEETTNYMEAETTLTKGISLCEKHRFTDLKFCMQYLHVKVLFQRNPKASLISIDAHIADCLTYKQIQWAYAFLFLKAAFYNQTGAASDRAAVENLHKLATIASSRGDKAICVMASLLEGLAHLRTMKSDAILRVQTCIANASKHQLEDTVRRPQVEVLLLLLDLACSIHQKSSDESAVKLVALTRRMEEIKDHREWNPLVHDILLPIQKQKQSTPAHSQVISPETANLLREGDDKVDYLVLPIIGMKQAWALGYTLHGLVSLSKSSISGKSSELWQEALTVLQDTRYKGPVTSLSNALKQVGSEMELFCYVNILIGLQAATLSDWAKVKRILQIVEDAHPPQGCIQTLHLYLTGAFLQGVAKIDEALRVFESHQFALQAPDNAKRGHIESEIAILAAFNRLWILEHEQYGDETKIAELIDQLQPLCSEHADPEIRATFQLILGTARINPPFSINQLKQYISRGAHLLKDTKNKQLLAISLAVMRAKLFDNVVGVQATKSARAAVTQARACGNKLWQSVTEGMLADTYETDGKVAEARASRGDGIRLANEARKRMYDAFS